jgi:hypothetical protein
VVGCGGRPLTPKMHSSTSSWAEKLLLPDHSALPSSPESFETWWASFLQVAESTSKPFLSHSEPLLSTLFVAMNAGYFLSDGIGYAFAGIGLLFLMSF